MLPVNSKFKILFLCSGNSLCSLMAEEWSRHLKDNQSAVLIAGAIKLLIPTSIVVNPVGGESMKSVLVAAFVAVLAIEEKIGIIL